MCRPIADHLATRHLRLSDHCSIKKSRLSNSEIYRVKKSRKYVPDRSPSSPHRSPNISLVQRSARNRSKVPLSIKATPPKYWSLSFLTPLLVDDAHPMLKSAILTLQTEEAGIFAFRQLWAEYSEYRQTIAIRSNQEDLNCKVNKLI